MHVYSINTYIHTASATRNPHRALLRVSKSSWRHTSLFIRRRMLRTRER